jgi:hypothetical protein
MEQDRPGKTVLQNGQAVPSVILKQNAPPETGASGNPCRETGRRWSRERLSAALDRAGEERLLLKAAHYRTELEYTDRRTKPLPGILKALGYSKNKLPFRDLARIATLARLEKTAEQAETEEEGRTRVQALLLGTAGLLPSQRSLTVQHPSIAGLEEAWESLRLSPPQSFPAWDRFKVRPGNHPVRRIMAFSYLFFRLRSRGGLFALPDILRRNSASQARRDMESALTISVPGYWEDHFDFNSARPGLGPVLLGRERAMEICINVILPFALAWSRKTGEPEPGRRALEAYSRYPGGSANSLVRHMLDQLSVPSGTAGTARRRQGLIHVYKTLCTRGKCRECEFGKG